MSILELGAHMCILYLSVGVTWLLYRDSTRKEPLTFLELFLYMEKNFDETKDIIKEESSNTQDKGFDYSQRVIDRIKKAINDDDIKRDKKTPN